MASKIYEDTDAMKVGEYNKYLQQETMDWSNFTGPKKNVTWPLIAKQVKNPLQMNVFYPQKLRAGSAANLTTEDNADWSLVRQINVKCRRSYVAFIGSNESVRVDCAHVDDKASMNVAMFRLIAFTEEDQATFSIPWCIWRCLTVVVRNNTTFQIRFIPVLNAKQPDTTVYVYKPISVGVQNSLIRVNATDAFKVECNVAKLAATESVYVSFKPTDQQIELLKFAAGGKTSAQSAATKPVRVPVPILAPPTSGHTSSLVPRMQRLAITSSTMSSTLTSASATKRTRTPSPPEQLKKSAGRETASLARRNDVERDQSVILDSNSSTQTVSMLVEEPVDEAVVEFEDQ